MNKRRLIDRCYRFIKPNHWPNAEKVARIGVRYQISRSSITPGTAPNTATISYGPMVSIPISLSGDGELVADTSGLPDSGPLDFIGDAADDWVAGLNARMKANGKKLSGLSVKGGKLTATKDKLAMRHAFAAACVPQPTLRRRTRGGEPGRRVVG